ncbi:uncharacterized protein [Lolium perenne]|uniref:uncharacterized protein n=1 Tax=Lolium perenne TaxID=4522 RepID=UPI0021F62AE1|nr:uncharacterized protein LOC127331676 [Lolium perenne]
MAVAKAEMPAWMRRPGAPAAVDAVIFLHYGMMWVATAACLAMVIGRRAFRLVEGSPVLSSASSLSLYSLTVGVLLYPVAIMLVGFRGMSSASKSKGNSKDTKVPPTPRQIARKMLKDPVMAGALVVMAFIMLIPAGDFGVVDLSLPKGSHKAGVGSVLRDVGILGACVVNCFIIVPTTLLRQWRMR